MFRRILCPIDFSPASARALEVAVSWAERGDAALELLHVFEPPVLPASEVAPLYVDVEASIVSELQDRMRARIEGVRARVPSASGLVQRGQPAARIVARAHETSADVIVLATSGHGLVARAMLGSVADRVLRSSHAPVLLVPHEGRDVPAIPRRILTPTDFSPPARATIAGAVALAEELHAGLDVVHAYEVPRFVERDPALAQALRQTMASDVLAEHPELGGRSGVRVHAHEGPAPATIVAQADACGADLIMMASTGRGWVSAMLLGGVTDRVARTSHVPVLVLRGGAA